MIAKAIPRDRRVLYSSTAIVIGGLLGIGGGLIVKFMLIALGSAAFGISMNNIIFEFAPEGRRPTYIGLTGTINALFLYSLLRNQER